MYNKMRKFCLGGILVMILLIIGNDFCNGQLEQDTMYRTRDTSNSAYGSHYSYSLQKKPSSNLSQKPVGLQNLTNTCYISAILQILFLILPESMNRGKGKITDLFFKLKATKDTKIYKIFKNEVEQLIQIVKGFEQQDAQEFLIYFLDALDHQNSQISKRVKVNLDYNQKYTIPENYKQFITEISKIQKSIITTLFSAELLREFKCMKNHVKHKFERYQCLSLSFPTPSPSFSPSKYSYSSSQVEITLEQLFNKQFQYGKQIISDLMCEQCKKRTDFEKASYLYTAPNFMIIHLARFKQGNFTNEKINTTVEFKDTFQVRIAQNKNIVKYRLIGTVNHFGTLNRGHYFAQVKHTDGNWYEINDEVVRPIRMDNINKSKYVYILFFERLR